MVTQAELEAKLWGAADILRGAIDSSDYKNYIFGFLFLKRLSDVFEEEAEKIKAETGDHDLAWNEPDEHNFYVPVEARWSSLRSKSENMGEALNKAAATLGRVCKVNKPSFQGKRSPIFKPSFQGKRSPIFKSRKINKR